MSIEGWAIQPHFITSTPSQPCREERKDFVVPDSCDTYMRAQRKSIQGAFYVKTGHCEGVSRRWSTQKRL